MILFKKKQIRIFFALFFISSVTFIQRYFKFYYGVILNVSVTQAAQATAASAAAQNSQGGAGAPAASTRRVVKGLKAPKSLAAKAMYKTEQKGPTKQNIFDGTLNFFIRKDHFIFLQQKHF